VGTYEQARNGVMLGPVDTLSYLYLVTGANNTHCCIDLMVPTFAHLNGTDNFA
jgi:hypothetical protein